MLNNISQTETPADNRDEAGPDRPGRFITLAAIQNLWAERDMAYAGQTLTAQQIKAIREFRKSEVNDLDPYYRAVAWVKAHTWFPAR